MKVICDREKLREGLAIANSVIPGKSTKPVLENVCLVATDDALEITATDMENTLRFRIEDVKVEEAGPAVVPARVTLDFVRDLSGETVGLETRDNHCHIHSGPDSCELVTVDPEEFPVIARFEDANSLSMQGGNFTRLVTQTAFAAAREAGRYAMNGILVEVQGDELRLVASDGRRLALASCPVDAGNVSLGEAPTIVPTKAMQLLCRVVTDPLDQIRLQFGPNQVGLKSRNAEVFARLVEGEFPRYAAVIPAETTHSMQADTDTFGKKLRLVANVVGDEARAVKLKLAKGELHMFGRSAGRGEAKANMDVEFKDGPAEIAFNPDFVLDGLKHCAQDHLTLEFNEANSPGKFRLGENFIYIVMPITVDA